MSKLIDGFSGKQIMDIPAKAKYEWNKYTKGITEDENAKIQDWFDRNWDKVASSKAKVQPAGWLGSGFNWAETPLMPIYRECCKLMYGMGGAQKEAKSGHIFGLYAMISILERDEDETWYTVKDENYKAQGVPIRSRIYFTKKE